jgi:signal transduction histidine kinase
LVHEHTREDALATSHVGRLTGVRFHEVAPRALFFGYRLSGRARAALLVASMYYAGCLAGFALRFPASGISFFWPPTAVLTAALLVVPFNRWPILLASSFLGHAIAHWQDGIPIAAWPIQYFGNASQAALAAWLVRRYSATPHTFASARSVLAFIVGAGVVAPAAASLIPAYVYVSLGWAADFPQAWRVRFISNAIAMSTMVPPLLVTWRFLSTRPGLAPRRIVEFALLLLGVSMPHVVVHYTAPSHPLGMAIVLYAPVPLLLWAAVRFGVAGVAFTLLSITLVTISTALHGLGPWGDRATPDGVIAVQLILAANAIPMMLLAGATEQSRREHASLIAAEHHRTESARALRDANDALVRMGRVAAMAEISASIAHELHQPLSAIVANASAGVHLIKQDTPREELREVFTDILHDSRRAAQIIQNTRRMFTHKPMRTRSVDLNDVVRDIVEIATPRLAQADVRLNMHLDDRLPAVLADTVQMQQVLLNLLTNAVEAMRDVVDRPRRLEIATRHGRRHAIVSVRDTGHGLGPAEAARIFQPFYTTRRGGTGMGLPISHTIVRNHMGALWAVPNVDQGMTFRFKIPLLHAIPRGAHDIT